MKKTVRLSESELNNIVKKIVNENEFNEGIFSKIKGGYQGLKGVWRGEGYDYYSYISQLGDLAKELKRLDTPNQKIMDKLEDLKMKIGNSKMPQDKKNRIVGYIDQAKAHFRTYEQYVNAIENAVKTKLN